MYVALIRQIRSTYLEVGICQVHFSQLIAQTRYIHDGRATSDDESLFKEKIGQEEMPYMICCELALDPIFGSCEILWRHDSGIVDQVVNLVGGVVDLFYRSVNRRIVKQVYFDEYDFDRPLDLFDLLYDRGNLVFITTRQK